MKRNILRSIILLAVFFAGMNMGWAQWEETKTMSAEVEAKIAARQQITNLPTIYITIPDINLNNISNELFKDRQTNTAEYHNATIKLVGGTGALEDFEDDVQIKVRGNSTADPQKRPYRLKFAKDEKDANGTVVKTHKHDMLGKGYAKRNWTLLANAFDHSFIRNAITYHLGQYVEMPFCPGYQYADLVIIDGNGKTDYRGLYQISDHVEVGKNRIDVGDNDWALEFVSWTNMMEEPCFTGSYLTNIKNPDVDDWTEDQITALKDEVKEWENAWNTSFQSSNATSGWPAYNDVETLVKFYVAINITGDYDGFFVMKGARKLSDLKFIFGPLWDKDLAYNNCEYADVNELLVENISNGQFRWNFINYLSKDALFMEKVKTLMTSLDNNNLYDKLASDIDMIVNNITSSRELDNFRWGVKKLSGESIVDENYANQISQLKTYLENRMTFLKEQFASMYQDCVLSETVIYNPENAWWGTGLYGKMNKIATVQVQNRTLQANVWNTFCIPFDATEVQIREALGCEFVLATHTGMSTDGSTMLFSELTDKSIKAGYPYLIKPTSAVNSMTFKDVIITTDAKQNVFNGFNITFDNKHYFYGTLFWGYNIDTNTDYKFGNDIYDDGSSLTQSTNDNERGARSFIRVTDGSAPHISFEDDTSEPIVIDMSSTENQLAAYNGNMVAMQFSGRGNLYADGWCTICLPFTMTKKDFEAAIGMETKLREVDSATGSTISFKKLTDDVTTGKKTMYAGVPYLIMIDPGAGLQTAESIVNLDDVTFENVKIEATEGTPVDAGNGYAYVGTLKATNLATDGTNMFLGASDKLYKPYPDPSKNSPLSGGKAYFVVPANTSNVKMVIDGNDEDFSAIKNMEIVRADGQVYNLNGQVMKMKLNELPHGIYIVNGKKYVK